MALRRRPPAGTTTQDERRLARDFAGLVAALDDPDPTTRRWAARDLEAHREASPALVARLAVETDVSVREVILTSLTCLGDDTAVDGLIQALRSEDALLRNGAIVALQQLPDAVAPRMEALLADPDSDVRIFAVRVLESLRHPRVEDWLLEVIERDAHLNVCATAVDLLGEVASPRARAPLEALKRRFPDEPYIQFAADLALRRIGEV